MFCANASPGGAGSTWNFRSKEWVVFWGASGVLRGGGGGAYWGAGLRLWRLGGRLCRAASLCFGGIAIAYYHLRRFRGEGNVRPSQSKVVPLEAFEGWSRGEISCPDLDSEVVASSNSP
jgi:hypothetical protein